MEFNPNSPFHHSPQGSGQGCSSSPVSGGGSGANKRAQKSGQSSSGPFRPHKSAKTVFDVFSWYPNYQSCLRYFLEKAQFEYACQALAAFLNIKLPYQRLSAAEYQKYQVASITNIRSGVGVPPPFRTAGYQGAASRGGSSLSSGPGSPGLHIQSVDYLQFGHVSLLPYIRRLVVTGYDADGIMHGWFGDDWMLGLNPLLESERQNYMFAAKSGNWSALKKSYDKVTEETVPFLVPLQRVTEPEIVRAEEAWSSSLSMQDWMLGPRSVDDDEEAGQDGLNGDEPL